MSVPIERIQATPQTLVTNPITVIYVDFTGNMSCEGNPGENKTILVDGSTTVRQERLKAIWWHQDTNDQLDCCWGKSYSRVVKVLYISESEMPPSMTPSGVILLKVQSLSPDGGINPHSTVYGVIAIVRKGVGTETTMFHLYNDVIVVPFMD